MDLTKLSPAPWMDGGADTFGEGDGWVHVVEICKTPADPLIRVDCDFPDKQSHTANHPGCDKARATVQFIVAARNALDVQMRLGWGVMHHDGGWRPLLPIPTAGAGLIHWMNAADLRWPTPTEAILGAYGWYRDNVEAKAERGRP